MGCWGQVERRQNVRYEVLLDVIAIDDLLGGVLTILSHDISIKGAGLIVDKKLTPGDTIKIFFIMSDDAQRIPVSGKVVWVDSLGFERYRVGVVFSDHDLRPIPMVLRSIKVRTSRYYC